MSKPIQIVSLCSTILLAGLYLIGCETSVDPILELDRPYTLWGFLDMTALPELNCSFIAVPVERGQQLKEPAQLDGWLRDGSARYVEKLCDFGEE